MWAWLVELAPERRRDAIDEVGERAWTVLTAYTRGVVFVATVDAVLIGAALLVVGVPLALPLIVLTWLAAFFPIIGAIVAGAAAVLVALVAERADRGADRAGGDRRRPAGRGQRPLPGRRRPAAEAAPDRRARRRSRWAGRSPASPARSWPSRSRPSCGALLAYHRERRGRREDAAAVPPRRGVMVGNGTTA